MKNQLINLIFSIAISPLKVLKLSNRGSLTFPSPLAFAEGLFIFYKYPSGKRRILIFNIEYRNLRRIISPIKTAYMSKNYIKYYPFINFISLLKHPE